VLHSGQGVYTGGASLLFRDTPPHYAFVGNSNTANAILLATSQVLSYRMCVMVTLGCTGVRAMLTVGTMAPMETGRCKVDARKHAIHGGPRWLLGSEGRGGGAPAGEAQVLDGTTSMANVCGQGSTTGPEVPSGQLTMSLWCALSSGDYLYIYNIDTGFPYQPSYLGRCKIVARSEDALMVATLPFETCGGEKNKGRTCQVST
jgi:hypothetical protein